MTTTDTVKLNESDPEDIGNVLGLIDKSFALKLDNNAFDHARTYGDICDIVTASAALRYEIEVDNKCTTQKAFYKIREAISNTQLVQQSLINPGTRLDQLFPRAGRRRGLKEVSKILNIKIDILSMKGGLFTILTIGFIASLITFFFNSQLAWEGLIFTTIACWVANKFNSELDMETVGDFTKKLVRENYMRFRTHQNTINKKEMLRIIDDLFINKLLVSSEELYRDAPLGWK
ncbi:MAG: hypothetical protein V4722_26810 [Bacteroidota bacterium]